MLSLLVPSYTNGFHVENMNCIDIPIAVAAGCYNFENYYKYAFYNFYFKNFDCNVPIDFTLSKNVILNKFGLSIHKHTIQNGKELFDFIYQKLSLKIPILIMAKYKYMFFANQYNDPLYNSQHFLFISDYNKERSIIALRDFIYQRQYSYPETRGELISRLPVDKEIFEDIWNKSNIDFHNDNSEFYNSVFTLEKDCDEQIVTSFDVLKDWIENYRGKSSLFLQFVQNFNNNLNKYLPEQFIKMMRRTFLMPFRNVFELIFRVIDKRNIDPVINEGLWDLHCSIFDIRFKIISELNEKVIKKQPLSDVELSNILTQINNSDNELINFMNKIYKNYIDSVPARTKNEAINLAEYAAIKASSESRSAIFAIRKNNQCWVSTWADLNHWMMFTFDKLYIVDKIIITHHGDKFLNTRDFEIQGSVDGTSWINIETIIGNCNDVTIHKVNSEELKHVRILISNPSINDAIARIRYIEIIGKM